MSKTRIERLTSEQEALLGVWRDKWRKISLSTEPANRKEAETGINLAYQANGLKPPDKIVWCGSPLAATITDAMIRWALMRLCGPISMETLLPVEAGSQSIFTPVKLCVPISMKTLLPERPGRLVTLLPRNLNGISMNNSVWNFVSASISDARTASVHDLVMGFVDIGQSLGNIERDPLTYFERIFGRDMGNSLGNSVWDSMRDALGASVWDFVTTSTGNSMRDVLRTFARDYVYGEKFREAFGDNQHGADQVGLYDYFREVLNLRQETDPMVGLIHQAQHGGWFFPCERICWAVERPTTLHFDENGRLHAASGPALSYPAGWSLYVWHGVWVPEYVIMAPQKITAQDIQGEANIEIRRVKLERYGLERYILDAGLKPIHQDDYGTLYRENFSGEEPLCVVRVTNATPEADGTYKAYFLRVPPDMETALEAVAWTFGMRPEEYRPVDET